MPPRNQRRPPLERFVSSLIRGTNRGAFNTRNRRQTNPLISMIRSGTRARNFFQSFMQAAQTPQQRAQERQEQRSILSLNSLLRTFLRDEIAERRRTEREILDFARNGERSTRNAEEFRQEYRRNQENKKDVLSKSGRKVTSGFFKFLKDLVINFLKYKVLDWISKPQNTKYITGTLNFLTNVFKTFKFIYNVLVKPITPIIKGISSGLGLLWDVLGGIRDIVTLKWLSDPQGILKPLSNMAKSIIENTPNLIMTLLNSMTSGIFSSFGDLIEKSIQSFLGTFSKKESIEIPPAPMSDKAISETKIETIDVSKLPKPKDTSDKNVPQLRSGGIVGPIKEASKNVSVKPLDKISEYSGISGILKKSISSYMKLLTIPFKVIGVGLISLITNSVSQIPGISYILSPFLKNIIGSFDLPQSILSMQNFKNPFSGMEKSEERSTTSKPQASTSSTQNSDKTVPSGGPSSPMPEGTKMKLEELRQIAEEAGFDAKESRIMAAIAMAESSGNPNAHNKKRPDNSYGLWQINMIDDLGPERRAALGLKSNEDLFDPKINAKAAKYIRDRQGLSAWSVYRNNLHLPYMKMMKSKGGWITGPKSGYPVSLDGESISFIGHGTEWVGMKNKEAFVVPFDTPDTDKDPRLVHRRYKEAQSNGFPLPSYSRGGKVKRPPSDTSSERTSREGIDKAKGSGGMPAVISVGKLLLNKGFTVAEHPNFTKNNWSGKGPNTGVGYNPRGNSRVGGHSNGSLHYSGLALDVTDWRGGDWLGRTKQLAEFMFQNRRQFKLTQIIHDPWGYWLGGSKVNAPFGGHGTHLHLGFASGPGADIDSSDYSGSESGGGGTDSKPANPADQFLSGATDLVSNAKFLYSLLHGGNAESSASAISGVPQMSSNLKNIKNQDTVDLAYGLKGKSAPSNLVASNQSVVSKGSSNLFASPLGSTLPITGSHSIFKINI